MRTTASVLGLLLCLLLAGCTVAGQTPEENPEGLDDPAIELTARLKDTPSDLDAAADLLRIQISRGDEEGARRTAQYAVHHNPEDFRARMLSAQYHRWQLNLLEAEGELLAARDLAPDRVEPHVALANFYRETALEDEELTQWRVALELSDPAVQAELRLRYAYSFASAGRPKDAEREARVLLADEKTAEALQSRALLLLAELALEAGDEKAVVEFALSACAKSGRDRSTLAWTARLTATLADAGPLQPTFAGLLESSEDPELRFVALFGQWMIVVQRAILAGESPRVGDAQTLWERLQDLDPGHPDVLSRRWQLLSLTGGDAAETARLEETLRSRGLSTPLLPSDLDSLLDLWRAEDALRLGAPRPCLDALTQLRVRNPELPVDLLEATALFAARDDETCLALLESLNEQLEAPDPVLTSMRRQIFLRQGKAAEVLHEMERSTEEEGTGQGFAGLWMEAVARFHTYRAARRAEDAKGS